MSELIKIENLKELIIEIRDEKVLLDADVAEIYGFETRDINKAVANNPAKFPSGYIIELNKNRKTLDKIFSDPICGNLPWNHIESLLIAVGI